MPPQVEDIPDADRLSRHLYSPSMGTSNDDLRWDNVFMFERKYGRRDSLVWSKYAPTSADIHSLGCYRQWSDRAKQKSTTYFGAIVSAALVIRGLRSKNGARFLVVHARDEGIHHAEITFAPDPPPGKNDLSELKVLLREKAFGAVDQHSCEAPPAAI
jgi:hypothetical protein